MPAVIKIEIISSSADKGLKDTARGLDDIDKAARNTKGGFGIFGDAAKAAAAVAVTALAGAVAAVGAFAVTSVQAAGTFEGAVNGLAAVAGDSLSKAGFSLEDVSAKALQLGQDTQYSAQEAILAMTELAKGGVPVASVMSDATDATLALAAAAGTDLTIAAEIVAKQLGVWSETGVSAAQVTDLLAGAANASTVDVEDLALGLANAGGTAKTAGVEFSDLVQTMALIAPNFSSASDAGTSLKTFLSRLIPTTENAKAAMAELGLMSFDTAKALEVLGNTVSPNATVEELSAAIENMGVSMGLSGAKLEEFTSQFTGSAFFDAQGSFVGMEAAAQMLQEATAGLSEEQKLLAFNTIFGSDAIRAAAAIANAGAEGYNAMGQAIIDSGGASEAAAIKQQGFAFAMEQLSGSVETLQIVLGTKLLPILTPLIGQFTEGVNKVLEFANAISGGQEPIAALTAQFPQLQGAIDALNQVWLIAQPYVDQFTNTLNTQLIPAAMAVWSVFTTQVIPILQNLATAVLPLFPAIIQMFAAYWTTVLVPALTAVWAFFTDNILPVLALVAAFLAETLPPIIQTIADFFTQTFLPALTALAGFVTGTLLPALTNIVALGFNIVYTAVTDLANKVSTALQPAIDAVAAAMDGPMKTALTNLEPAGKGVTVVVDAIAGAFNSVVKAISGAVAKVKEFLEYAAKIKVPNLGAGGGGGTAAGAGAPAGKALGGPVMAGEAYMVGERGPELFVPQRAGSIVDAGRTAGQKYVTNNYNYSPTYSATPANPSADFGMMRSLATAGT